VDPSLEFTPAMPSVNWVSLGLMLLAALVLAALSAVGIGIDAARRGTKTEAAAWGLAAFLFPPLVLPLYLLRAYLRPQRWADPPAVLPWVRTLNFLNISGWATLVPASVMIGVFVALMFTVGPHVMTDITWQIGVQGMILAPFVIVFTVGTRWLVDRRPAGSLGTPLAPADLLLRQFAGVVVGAGAPLLLVGILLLAGQAELTWAPTRGTLLGAALLAIPLYLAAFMEEITMRGYVQRTLYSSWGHAPAVLLSAVPFALMHLGNPNPSVLGLVNIALVGVFLSLTVIRTGNLWFATGCHVAWNFTLGPVLAIPVSGMEIQGLFHTEMTGADWLTGGAFGLEASPLATLLFLAMTLAALGTCLLGRRYDEPDERTGARPLAGPATTATGPG